MRICLIDTVYPEVLPHMPLTGDYETSLRSALDFAFGTSDFFSRNLRALGHECVDIVANHHQLQHLWAKSEKWSLPAIALQQIEAFKPDCLFLQDLSFFDASTLRMLGDRYALAAQCSCALPRTEIAARYDVIFSSIPPHVEHFKSLGVRGEYLPLAFEHTLLDRIPPQERDIDVSFVGGVGASLHWKAGTHALEALAKAIGDRFHWYGYGLDRLATDSPLRKCYRGEAWGLAQYGVYARSKIVVSRHGEISQGYTNNLRCFEATGCGAMLMTEASLNLGELFPDGTVVPYASAGGLIENIRYYLEHETERIGIARAGQDHTLQHHNYSARMAQLSRALAAISSVNNAALV